MAAITNHHFAAATLAGCGQPYPDLGTKGSWDTCPGTVASCDSGTAAGAGEEAGPGHGVLAAGWGLEVLVAL